MSQSCKKLFSNRKIVNKENARKKQIEPISQNQENQKSGQIVSKAEVPIHEPARHYPILEGRQQRDSN